MIRLDKEKEEEAATEGTAPSPIVEKALFKWRIVMLTGEVNDLQARRTTERLFAMAGESDDPITFVISSPGGHVESGDMIHDVVRFIRPRVNMLGTGWVASAGALIFCSVPKTQRYCLPNTRFLLHEPRGGVGGMASDVEIQAREILRMRERLTKIFAEATGQSVERIRKDTDRDHWMMPQEAIDYGLVGKVVQSAREM